MSGGEKAPEPSQRVEDSCGLFGVENGAAAAEADDGTQNGARSARSRSDESPLLNTAAVEDRDSPRSGHRKTGVSGALDQTQTLSEGLGASFLRPPEDLPLKKNFQIPRKSREKKGCYLESPLPHPSFSFLPLSSSHSTYMVTSRTPACSCWRAWRKPPLGSLTEGRASERARDPGKRLYFAGKERKGKRLLENATRLGLK